MKLYDLPRSEEGTKIYGLKGKDNEDLVIRFYHLDGMYSYCKAFDEKGKELGTVHLSAGTPLKKFKDGYTIDEATS
jgi:hypothetical protein